MRQIMKIAKKVRKRLEEIQDEHDPDNWYGGLCGACCVGTYMLMKECRRKGIVIHGAVARGHAFCVYKNKIVDVTATQFGVDDKVYVSPFDNDGEEYPWDAHTIVREPAALLQAWSDNGADEDNEQHPQSWINEGMLPPP